MRCHSVACGTHTRAVDPISECIFCSCPTKSARAASCHDPARHPRSLSAGDLHLGGCARLSKDAGSLIPVPQTCNAVIRVYDEAGNVIGAHEEAHASRLFMLDSES
jgi:hypothetical protein